MLPDSPQGQTLRPRGGKRERSVVVGPWWFTLGQKSGDGCRFAGRGLLGTRSFFATDVGERCGVIASIWPIRRMGETHLREAIRLDFQGLPDRRRAERRLGTHLAKWGFQPGAAPCVAAYSPF
jgi:hypothetical protein